jgi:type IV pilus assembly protein PilQ
VNRSSYFHPLIFTSALLTLAAQPGIAAMTTITGVQLNPTDGGLELVFDTEGGDASNIFTVSQGNTLRADITRAQLDLPNGDRFTQANPAPGISQITVIPLDANSVRVTIDGTTQAPRGEIISQPDRVVLALHNDAQAAATPTPVPEQIATVPGPTVPAPSQPTLAQTTPAPTTPAPEVLVPNPDVTINGVPAQPAPVNPVPPLLPRAVAPPVGDIAVAESVPTFTTINLGTNQVIPRLLLRDAPAREVLALLARAANLNVVFTAAGATPADGITPEGEQQVANNSGPTISLDIENESVQEVFNHVLRVAGLQANQVGRSIYVGPTLPVSAQNVSIRTLRLNQARAQDAAQFLVSLGAQGEVVTATQTKPITAVGITVQGATNVAEEVAQAQEQAVEAQQVQQQEGNTAEAKTGVLTGLTAVADTRTNSITLTGRPDLIAIATEQLSRIDLRQRQVAINVRVIDVNLSAIDELNTSFGFSIGNVGIGISSGGLQVNVPNSQGFFLNLLAQVQNGNAKILTDPTLIIQEGQTATVGLTSQVVQQIKVTITNSDSGTERETREAILVDAGLVLGISVDRIDDNGFVTLSVAPSISAPVGEVQTDDQGGFVTLLSQRVLQSGQVRVRDEQTLLLSGIIQESERSSVTKVPILGDIPILGALFRSTEIDNKRQELIVLLTPQILDDSDQSVFGYSYTPREETQEVLNQSSR